MPTYEYKCVYCENGAELSRPIDQRDAVLSCEKCGNNMNRVTIPSSVGVQFKGTGFYKTDNPR